MSVDVRLLGLVEADVDGRSVRIDAPRERALLALLALQDGRPLSVDAAIDAIWGSDPPPSARNAVQVYVSHLRSRLGRDAVLRVDDGYRFQGATDTGRFLALAQAGHEALAAGTPELARRLLAEALDLFPGPALGGCGDAHFVPAHCARLAEVRLSAVEDLHATRHAMHDDGVAELRELVTSHPYRERLWAMLIRGLYAEGRRADALAAFAQARGVLAGELGIDPGPELTAVHHAVLTDDVSLTAPLLEPVAWSLPAPPVPVTSLIGRMMELREVAALLTDGRIRLLTLLGPGGVGKTRLALEASRRRPGTVGDGVCWVPLAGLTADAEVLPAIAHAVGARDTGAAGLAGATARSLAGRHLLLVLDNAEHVVDGCVAAVVDLLERVSDLTILCTSRAALRITGEHRFRVAPLSVAGPVDGPGAAVALFLARADDVRAGDLPLAEVAALCTRLDGLPLAIEIAASRCNLLTTAQLLEQLDDRLGLTSTASGAPERHRSLRAVLDWSNALLPEQQRVLLARLSVFRGGFTTEGAIAVADEGSHDALAALDGLLEASLVTRSSDDGRLSLLETVRQYAAEDLTARGLEQYTRDRHARHLVEVVRRPWRSTPPLKFPRNTDEIAVLEAERDNLLTAIAHASSHPDETLLADLVIHSASWWMQGAAARQLADWLDTVLARPLIGQRRIDALLWRRTPAWRLGEPYPPQTSWRSIRQHLTETPDTARQAHVEALEALDLVDLGGAEPREVAERAETAIRCAQASGDPDTIGWIHVLAGSLPCGDDDENTAEQRLQHGIEVCTRIGDQAGAAIGNSNLSDLRLRRGDGAGAAAAARAALACESTRDADSIRSIDHTNLGAALLISGELDEAEAELAAATRLAARMHQIHGLADIALYFAIAAGLRGADLRAAALAHAHRALTARVGVEPEACARALLPLLRPAMRRMDPADISTAAELGVALSGDSVAAALLNTAWPQQD